MFHRRLWIATQTVLRHRLTWRAWLVVVAICAAVCLASVCSLYPFLAVNAPVESCDTLVIEGWIPDYLLEVAADKFRRGEVVRVYTTGIPIERGGMLVPWQDFAHVAEATLVKLGVPDQAVIPVPTPARRKDRTEASAEALKPVLEAAAQAEQLPRRFNVLTLGPHARRTRLVYRRIFEQDWKIGIINMPSHEYDPDRWWRSSAGVKAVAGEATALVYTWLR